MYKALGGGWISQEEIDKYAQQIADELEVDVSTIDKDALNYNGQAVDLILSPEEKQARKEVLKTLRKQEKEKERRKLERKNKQ